ncbi:unnamed protein product [Rotaria sp. Silwood2]|nr:unnamed protein product [Rotaria sp. Silwood2]
MQTTPTNTSAPALPKARFNWIFSADKFTSTPSNRNGIPPEEELALRQHAAVFIYELGTNLKVPHYCINTAVVYMHRFYMINSFQRFTRQRICAASLFLACKVEEFPRTLRDVIENTGKVLRRKKAEELTKEMIEQYADDIVLHENILLSTLGFSLMVDHPHSIIIKTIQALGNLADEFLAIYEKCPDKIKRKLVYQNERQPQAGSNDGTPSSQHHPSASNIPPRVPDIYDSVVPQGSIRDRIEHRQNQTSLQTNRPTGQPPQPPSTQLPPQSQSSSMPIKREPSVAPPFSSSNRPPMPPHNASSSTTSRPPSFQHPPTAHYPAHHANNNYNQHSRYPPQQARPGPQPPATHPNRSSQQPPPLPPVQHNVDRKPPPPSNPYDHPAPPPPSASASAANRPPYGSQQRSSHYNNVPPPSNPYPQQPPYGLNHPPSLMQLGGEKRPYDPAFDSNNANKRPRPSSASSSSSQPWNNK